jgi:triacylglycerol lipase
MGWGPEEMSGYNYWGGNYDYVEYLDSLGYEIYNVSVGPISSNWDCAVEAYYQIKGGQVDYGERHSKQYGIIQKPSSKKWPGLYPEWDADHPIHIIGHSMGGQTARRLQYLLETEIYVDSTQAIPESSDLLGHKHQDWIRSITTMSSPHNGTTLSDIVTKSVPFLQDFIGLAAVIGNRFYSFDLEQWAFKRNDEESWSRYFTRIRSHPAWGTRNFSSWDVSLEGARQLNTLAVANKNIYYFSFATSNTHFDSLSGNHVPNKDMGLILRPNARAMGKQIDYWADSTSTDSTWFENDGIVNTISMIGPTTGLNGSDPIIEYQVNKLFVPGSWYYMGKLTMDHRTLMGHGKISNETLNNILLLFKEHAERLHALPHY